MSLDQEFSSISWLRDHHESKLTERERIVNAFDLRKGDEVLDVGCGPGLWLSLLSDAVGPSGRIVGYDLNYRYLKHAHGLLHRRQQDRSLTVFVQGDFSEIPFTTESFDFVFSCNALLYHSAPVDLIRHFSALVRPGGRIAIVHFDDAMTCYHPIEPELTLRVLTATAEALRDTYSGMYDNYLGRKLHSLFIDSGLTNVETSLHPIYRHSPLDEHIEKHIRGIARWQARVGAEYLDNETRQAWLSYFDPESPNYILRTSKFSFCTVDFVTIGTRHSAAGLRQQAADS